MSFINFVKGENLNLIKPNQVYRPSKIFAVKKILTVLRLLKNLLLILAIVYLITSWCRIHYEKEDFEPTEKLVPKLDVWQYIGPKIHRFKVFSAYFENRKEAFGRKIPKILFNAKSI